MREDDILLVEDLRVGDLLQWGSSPNGRHGKSGNLFMLLHIETEYTLRMGEIFLYFIDVKNNNVYTHSIEPDNHFVYCIRVNKNS
jgi:hypothetical protein